MAEINSEYLKTSPEEIITERDIDNNIVLG